MLAEVDEDAAAANADNPESAATIQEMSVKVTAELDCGADSAESPIHSIVWEDLEPMEGQEHSQLISANKSKVQLWDLNSMIIDQEITVRNLFSSLDEDDCCECMVVKRDPHD